MCKDSQTLFLHQQLYGFKMHKGKSISVHLNKIMKTGSELKSSKEAPSEKEVIAAIFNHLPKGFSSVIAVLKVQQNLSLKFALSFLWEEGNRSEVPEAF